MPYTEAGKNNMLEGLGATHVAAFSGNPTSGGTELDRQPVSFGAASGGEREQTGAPVLSISGGATVDHIGYFDAATGGTLVMYDPVTPEAFGNDGTYRLDSSHHDLNNDPA